MAAPKNNEGQDTATITPGEQGAAQTLPADPQQTLLEAVQQLTNRLDGIEAVVRLREEAAGTTAQDDTTAKLLEEQIRRLESRISEIKPPVVNVEPRFEYDPDFQKEMRQNTRRLADSIDQLSRYDGAGSSGLSPSSDFGTTLKDRAEQAFVQVTGVRPDPAKPDLFLKQLEQVIQLNEVEGHTEYLYKPTMAFLTGADFGMENISGEQAGFAEFVTTLLEPALQNLALIEPIRPNPDTERITAVTYLLSEALTNLQQEAAHVGGARYIRMTQITDSVDALLVELGHELGMLNQNGNVTRRYVIHSEEERELTKYLSLQKTVNAVKAGWIEYAAEADTSLGTGFGDLGNTFRVVADMVNQFNRACDKLRLGKSERQIAIIPFDKWIKGRKGYENKDWRRMSVEDFMSWVYQFFYRDAVVAIQRGGLLGLNSLIPTLETLNGMTTAFANILSKDDSPHDFLPAGLYHPSVRSIVEEMQDAVEQGLSDAKRIAN